MILHFLLHSLIIKHLNSVSRNTKQFSFEIIIAFKNPEFYFTNRRIESTKQKLEGRRL